MLNRLSWGATSSLLAATPDTSVWLEHQLQARAVPTLPAEIDAQIQAMAISQRPLPELMRTLEKQRLDADAMADEDAKKTARQAYQQELGRLAREAATRHLLRAVYSPSQVHEQMTWFWLNHFNVSQNKANLRAMVGDYENTAIRPHALGRFRDLLGAVVVHPAMLRYLDNERNAAGRLNENFARELMELHTLGVDAGYSQGDVQELARVLTGVGISLAPEGVQAPLRRELQPYYQRNGLFEFHPARHDFGPKSLLGEPLRAKGLAELDEALDRLARHPATARFIGHKLAQFWLADAPPPALVARLAERFLATQGDIAAVLRTLFASPEFAQGANEKFKDPMRFVVSAVRLAYDDRPILNAGPMLAWLNRLGEPLYGRQTPDGYPMTEAAWASPGQMAARFEVAKAIGAGAAGLFRGEGPQAAERAAFPQLSNAMYFQAMRATLGVPTRTALEQAGSPQEWNGFLLSSPEMMRR